MKSFDCDECNYSTYNETYLAAHKAKQHNTKGTAPLTLPEKLVELDHILRSDKFHKFYSEHLIDGPAVQCDGVYHYSPTPMACGHEGSPCPLKYTAEYQKTLMQLFEKFL